MGSDIVLALALDLVLVIVLVCDVSGEALAYAQQVMRTFAEAKDGSGRGAGGSVGFAFA
ncbi:MAG: hypothetical protein WC475_01690 [Candidatus Paceibacterota bacterium]